MSRIHESTLKRRFYERVEPDLNSGCWLWTGTMDECGYGRVRGPIKTRAHRMSYMWNVGDIPDGRIVMHKCDTPACVNPNHLRVGTQLENIKDRVVKGRCNGGSQPGERSPLAKITAADAANIVARRANGETFGSIGKDYPISVVQVRRIAIGQRWNKGE
jgi:hypothetical protein